MQIPIFYIFPIYIVWFCVYDTRYKRCPIPEQLCNNQCLFPDDPEGRDPSGPSLQRSASHEPVGSHHAYHGPGLPGSHESHGSDRPCRAYQHPCGWRSNRFLYLSDPVLRDRCRDRSALFCPVKPEIDMIQQDIKDGHRNRSNELADPDRRAEIRFDKVIEYTRHQMEGVAASENQASPAHQSVFIIL